MAKKTDQRVILPSDRYAVPTDRDLVRHMSDMDVSDRQRSLELTSEVLPAARIVIRSDRKLTGDDVDVLTDAYIHASQIRALGDVLKSEIRDRVQRDFDAKGVLEITSDRFETQFSNSKPNRSVTFDLDGLRRDHPEILKLVTGRSGKPMSKDDRKELDDRAEALRTRISDLNRELAMLQSKIAADDSARETKINEELLDQLISNDSDLEEYRHVTVSSSRFYFKNIKR